jgi:hypothetical protein
MSMRRNGLIYAALAASLFAVGCSDDSKDALPAVKAPEAASVGVSAPAPVAPAPGAPQAGQPAAPTAVASSEPSEPQLAPIQSAIQAFEEQNKRMPQNVQELVESGAMKNLPPLPAGKIYYIDHATKKVKIGGGP